MAAPARQLRRIDGVAAAVGSEHQELRRRLGEERELEPVVGLEGETGKVGDLAAQRADPALFGHHDGDRLALDQRLLDRGLVVRGRFGKAGAALAERRSSGRTCRAPRGSRRRSIFHCAFSERSRSSMRFFSARSVLVLLADLDLLEPAQIAQPHVEDGVGLHVGELERLASAPASARPPCG